MGRGDERRRIGHPAREKSSADLPRTYEAEGRGRLLPEYPPELLQGPPVGAAYVLVVELLLLAVRTELESRAIGGEPVHHRLSLLLRQARELATNGINVRRRHGVLHRNGAGTTS